MPGDNSYFGTRAEVDAIKNRRNAEIRAWGKQVLEEADRAKFGTDFKSDWDVVVADDDEPINNEDDASLDEPSGDQGASAGTDDPDPDPSGEGGSAEEVPVTKPAKAKPATSKGSTADK